MTTFDDPEFGPMHFGGSEWVLERRALFGGAEVPVQIEPEDAVPREVSPVQRPPSCRTTRCTAA